MRGVDLNTFQFDYDLTWCGFFMNADGTIYGRYGSRKSARKTADELFSLKGLKSAMKRALELHAAYPANKDVFKDKKGPAMKFNRAETFPSLADQFKETDLPKKCIHCHHVWRGVRRVTLAAGKGLPDDQFYVYPLPETIGMSIDIDAGNTVKAVGKGSVAEKAGVKAGDEIASINRQPILSIADIQWILQNAADKSELKIHLKRGAEEKDVALTLPPGFRKADIAWRESSWDMRAGMGLGELTADEKKKNGLADTAMGFTVKFVAQNGPAKKAGIQQNDIVIEFDGQSKAMTETEMLSIMRQKYPLGAKIKLAVLRGGKKQEMAIVTE